MAVVEVKTRGKGSEALLVTPRWRAPAESFTLSRDEVHIWRANLDQPRDLLRDELFRLLSEDERIKARRLPFEEHRDRFVAATAIRRAVLSRYARVDPRLLEFECGAHGKPRIKASLGAAGLRFNLSHSGNLVLFAVAAEREVGIDVERLRPVIEQERIVERYFSADEKESYRLLPPGRRRKAFFVAWTRKEAHMKAAGVGLSEAFDHPQVMLPHENHPGPRKVGTRVGLSGSWFSFEFEPGNDFVAAVVVEGPSCSLRFWDWSREAMPEPAWTSSRPRPKYVLTPVRIVIKKPD
jgi:4'-phosphopantetheinyl transferase